jgi:hypothetical protein
MLSGKLSGETRPKILDMNGEVGDRKLLVFISKAFITDLGR